MPVPDLPFVIGLDLGTGGARAVIVSSEGEVLAMRAVDLAPEPDRRTALPDHWHEQDPARWWGAARAAVRGAVDDFEGAGGSRGALRAICVDGTSGTIVGLDARGEVCTPALMYNDGRAQDEARELNEWMAGAGASGGASIGASWSLAKMLWLERNEPERFDAVHCFAHQADYIATQLTGEIGRTDASNALKSGFDLRAMAWPEWLGTRSALAAKLPEVLEPGRVSGRVSDRVADELGLPRGLEVVAGATDGTAAFLASGAARVGDDNTTLGTTLVFKRLAEREPCDPSGLVYGHRLPDEVDGQGHSRERWLPGAASSVGGEWIREDHPGANLEDLDRRAAELLPVGDLAYPLVRTGERFPFLAPAAVGFYEGNAADAARFAAKLQGVAFIERLSYEVLDRVTGTTQEERRGDVFATGGGSASDVWMQLRADVTGRTIRRPRCHESAFGSALLAAANTVHGGLWGALRRMLVVERSFDPEPTRRSAYDELYRAFRDRLEERGYIEAEPE